MQNDTIYNILAIVVFLLLTYFMFRKKEIKNVKTIEEKQQEIVQGYKQELKEVLLPLKNNKELMMKKKVELLNKYNNELAMNIYFDVNEVKDIILELSRYDVL